MSDTLRLDTIFRFSYVSEIKIEIKPIRTFTGENEKLFDLAINYVTSMKTLFHLELFHESFHPRLFILKQYSCFNETS